MKIGIDNPLPKEVVERYAEAEITLLDSFLRELYQCDQALSYSVICDLESEVGLEIFS